MLYSNRIYFNKIDLLISKIKKIKEKKKKAYVMYKLSNSTKENTKRLGDVAINK